MAKDPTGMYIVFIVLIVSFVGISTAFLSSTPVSSQNMVGAVTAAIPEPSIAWTTCLDIGTAVKLEDGGDNSYTQKNNCIDQSGRKLLVDYFCARNADGFYTYKAANPMQCVAGKECLLDENGAAYCG